MASYLLAPGEQLEQCPYNRSHQITNLRMLTHLDKCRRAYRKEMNSLGKSVEIVPCRFNYSHQVPSIELAYHHRTCGDQYRIVEHIRYHDSESFKEMKIAHEKEQPHQDEDCDDGEDWDKDCGDNTYTAGYDPSKKLDTDNILYMPRGLSKSERKAYRKQQTVKFRGSEPSSTSHMCLVGNIEKELSK